MNIYLIFYNFDIGRFLLLTNATLLKKFTKHQVRCRQTHVHRACHKYNFVLMSLLSKYIDLNKAVQQCLMCFGDDDGDDFDF